MITFKHEWTSPLNPEETWDALTTAMADSSQSRLWPGWLSQVNTEGVLRAGGVYAVVYRFGPFRKRLAYQFKEVREPRIIVFDASAEHPFSGGERITLIPFEQGTVCVWQGRYRARDRSSLPLLAWFRVVYERFFFRALARNFRKLSPPKDVRAA